MTDPAREAADAPVTLVTGASRGIGRATALRLADLGHRVVLAGHEASTGLDETADRVAASQGRPPLCLTGDVADPRAVDGILRQLFRRHGHVDGLAACAGIMRPGLLGMVPAADIDRTLAVNTAGALHLIQAASRLMSRRGGGSIVLLSSVLARHGAGGNTVYAASKAAIDGIVRSAAQELGPAAIRVNAVAPGFVATDMTAALPVADRAAARARTALPRQVRTEDVAKAIAFLLSDDAACITGQVLGVDAGLRPA